MIPDDFDDEPVEVRMTIEVPDKPQKDGVFDTADVTWAAANPAEIVSIHSEAGVFVRIDGPMAEEERMARAAAELVEQARAFLVTDPASYQRAGEMIDQLKTKKRDVVGWFEPMANAAHAAWKAVTGKRAALVEPLDEAITVLSSRYATFAQQERARADAERRQLEREAQERERARLQAEADQLAQESRIAAERAHEASNPIESAAFTQQANALAAEATQTRIEAANVEAPVIAVRSRLADVKGPTVAAHWTFEVVDKRALIAAVAADEVSQEAVEPSDTYLGQFARANKGTAKIPGVRFYDAGSVRASRRR